MKKEKPKFLLKSLILVRFVLICT